jgi:hypothetical protein
MDNQIDKKSARNCAILFTILYTPLFIITLGFALLIASLSGGASSPTHFFEILIPFLTPLSIVLCLSLSWYQYWKKQYQNINVYCLAPILVFVITMMIICILS